MRSDQIVDSAARPQAVAPTEVKEAERALSNGPTGAFTVASIAVGLLFVGWLAFYFLLFMPRGSIG